LKTGETGVGNNVVAVYYRSTGSSVLTLLDKSDVIMITQAQLDSTLNLDTIKRLKFIVTSKEFVAKIQDDLLYTRYTLKNKTGSWKKDNIRMRVADNGNLVFLNDDGGEKSIWPGGPTTVKISSHLDYILMHADSDDINVDKFWVYSGTDNLIMKDKSVVMNDDYEFENALFILEEDCVEPNWTIEEKCVDGVKKSTWVKGTQLGAGKKYCDTTAPPAVAPDPNGCTTCSAIDAMSDKEAGYLECVKYPEHCYAVATQRMTNCCGLETSLQSCYQHWNGSTLPSGFNLADVKSDFIKRGSAPTSGPTSYVQIVPGF
jgi:hypothetical protein